MTKPDRPLPTRRSLLGLAAAGTLLAGLPAAAQGKRPALLATTGQVAELLRGVAGDLADVTSLMGEGIDPHSYKLTRADTVALMQADAIFNSGLFLEGKMTEVLDRVAQGGKPVHAAASAIPLARLIGQEGEGSHPDPHVWMDVSLWSLALEGVRGRLSTLYPDQAARFAARTAQTLSLWRRLDDYARTAMASVPANSRVLVTAHDAFSYFGRAYGLEVMGIQGISTESEAGLKRIESMVALLVERRIPAVFVETSVSDRNVQALVQGAAARGHTIRIGGALYSDAMGPAGTYEGTYAGMIDHNVTTMARALGGAPPAGGFQGRLAAR